MSTRTTVILAAVRAETIPELVRHALEEDVGSGDVTTTATVPEQARARAVINQKAPGVVFGLAVAKEVFHQLDAEIRATSLVEEGVWRGGGGVLELEGQARAILTGERTALNFLQRLSGVATTAARAVREVEGTGATVLDTRKTTPGLRRLEKAAVAAGGATNHRAGLYDAILIKENHIALAGGVGEAIRRAGAMAGDNSIEVECRSLDEVEQALAAGATRILLDNFDPARLRQAVERVAGRAELEASGGITLESIREIAQTGVQFISVGALTHSAPALDLSLTLEALP
jgi:nicotinate-nucleotide pyrophosphorylase (carboxylating)